VIVLRKAKREDIDAIKQLADGHRHELGFVRRPALLEAISQAEVVVAQNGEGIIGFMEYHHRRDEQTTLYNIVVQPIYRKSGIGRKLLQSLETEVRANGKSFILLKCPQDLPANTFYERLGYECVDVEMGKSRRLNIWRKDTR
jgi:N-acetylglutamate synthase-like GNAT family acetyltransferase